MKNIYIEPNEEIISVVDRLIQSDDNEVNLVVPAGAQIWQSSINLKLLKREASVLNKFVTLIVADDLGAEMAERIGFPVRKERELSVELVQNVAQDDQEEIQPESDVVQPEAQEDLVQPEIKDENVAEAPAELPVEDLPAKEPEMIEPEPVQPEKEMPVPDPEPVSQPVQSKDDMIELLVDELEEKKKPKNPFTVLTSWRKKPDVTPESNQKRMADIVTRQDEEKPGFFDKLSESVKTAPEPKLESVQPEPQMTRPVQIEKVPETKIFTEREKSSSSLKWSKLFSVFIIVAVVMAGLVGYLVLPNAEISLTPKTEAVNFDLSVMGVKGISQIDETLNEIPLQEVEVTKTKSKEFNTTGEEDINQKARGMITIYNEYSSEDQTLLARTRFESSDGKIFRIPQSITVPGAKIVDSKIVPSSLEVEVIADQPGDEYNIGPDDFTIPGFKGSPKFAGFYGKTTDSMSGGYVGKAKVVLSEDLENAETTLIDELKQEVRQSLEGQIPEDLRIVEDGLKEDVFDVSSGVNEGDQAEKFTMEVKVTMRALLFKEDDLKNLVDLNLISKVSDDKVPIGETQKISWQTPVIDWEKGEASFSLSVEESVASDINIQSLKENLAGQDEVEVRRYLASQTEIEKARISFWPFWVNKIPKQESKIKINIEI